MDTTQRFSTRAEDYARYRWDYAEAAIEAVCDIVQLKSEACMADIGAGTGILTRHFVARARYVYAVEPNAAMRRWAIQALAGYPALIAVDGRAEAIPLPDRAVELITVGQALHWFLAPAAKSEFVRILKPDGWLAVFRNSSTDPSYDRLMKDLRSERYGWDTSEANKSPGQPVSVYFESDDYLKLSFPAAARLNWESYFGALCSHSHAPEESHELFPEFQLKAREIFVRLSKDGLMTVPYATEVSLGQMALMHRTSPTSTLHG